MLDSMDYRTLPIFRVAVVVFLILVDAQNVYGRIFSKIDNQFNTYSFINPKLIHAKHKREIQSTKTNSNDLEHVHSITLNFFDKEKNYTIDLTQNTELISANYFEKHQKDGGHVINRPKANEFEFCNYNGKVRGFPGSWAAISTCNGIRGMFFDGSLFHYIENIDHDSGEKVHVLYRHDDLRTNHTCGFPSSPLAELIPNKIKRTKRNPRSLKGPYNHNDKSRYIELVLVVDQHEYNSFDNDLSKVYQHTKEIANIINSLFIPLNIFVALVGVVVWTDYNEISIEPNGDNTLTNFLHYRREHLVKDHPNDNAQLLTKIQFENGIVGKALKGPICTYEFSGGVNSDHSFVRGLVATTIAHEMGHNLGMEHDTPDCDCPTEGCIMAPSSGSLSRTHWSSCSMEYLALAFEHGMDYCLRNKPEKLFESPVCGNTFVEEGEECDCGMKGLCNNPCCNPETCMLHENATCATGQCCDLNTCHLKPAGLECRSALHECDLPEYCSGESEYCPKNVFKSDGSSCENNKAFCYKGSCRTHTDQCRLLWGPTGESSADQCYKLNTKGTQQGNCGYNRLNKTFTKCNIENVNCGMLQCKHKNERLEFGMETVSIVSYTFINNPASLIPCRTAIVDLGLNEVDPGLTPNGAKCGENMMCVNQKCMAVGDLRAMNKDCPNNCNGNGVCNNKGNCHCNVGYAPPYCDHPGPGGSNDSGPASSPNTFKGFMTGLYVLTFGTVPLLLAVLLFAYCSKYHSLPMDWNKTNRKKSPNDAEVGNKPNGTASPSSTPLVNSQKPAAVLQTELLGTYKGFSIKPLARANETTTASSRTPTRPAPAAPRDATAAAARSERPQIGQPVLDATTSSAVRELVSMPLKPAPPVPASARPAHSTTGPPPPDAKNNGGGGTLRRITSFVKNQMLEEKKPAAASARVHAKFDREELKNLEISEPILQNEINVPSEPLPLEAEKRRAVVLRAQSLRTVVNNAKRGPSAQPNFGSLRFKRPTSAVTAATVAAGSSRPTSPPPQPPPLPPPPQFPPNGYQTLPPSSGKRAVLPPPPFGGDEETTSAARLHPENIYSVIDENPADDAVYKVPKSLDSSLLGEIVSAIQERNRESIYTSRPAAAADDPRRQTYENFKPPSPPGSTASSSGYVCPADLKSSTLAAAAAAYDRPDLVKNCDENCSLNRSPDVLDAQKHRGRTPTGKPAVLFPKPKVGGNAASRPYAAATAATATVGLKKKLSDRRQPPFRPVVDVHKRSGNVGSGNKAKNPPVPTKPSFANGIIGGG